MQDRSMFVFRHANRIPKARAHGVVAIGWQRLHALPAGWQDLKAALASTYFDLYEGNSRAIGNAAGSIWRFAQDMKVGDYALIPVEGAFHVAEITGPVARRGEWANEDDDMAWHREARWRPETFSRLDVSNALQMRLKSRQTIVDASDCQGDVVALLAGKKPPKFVGAVQERTRQIVIDALRERANSDQLEHIVAALFRAQGALTSEVQPKNAGQPGDFDVIAQWPNVGLVEGLRVAAQVKHHEGQSGIAGIEQLIARVRSDQSIDRLVFITTAEAVSEEAAARAAQEDITILTQNDLADWLLSVGLDALHNAA